MKVSELREILAGVDGEADVVLCEVKSRTWHAMPARHAYGCKAMMGQGKELLLTNRPFDGFHEFKAEQKASV